MLEALATYADREGLVTEPGFSPKQVKWLIRFDRSGKFLGVDMLGEAEGKKNPGLTIPRCPEYPSNEMNAGGKAHPLVESLNVVALMPAKDGQEPSQRDEAKWNHFVGLLKELSNEVPEALAAHDALQNEELRSSIGRALWQERAKPTDKATLSVDDIWLVNEERAHSWWRTKRGIGEADSEGNTLDLISGELVTPLASHPKIAGLGNVGGSSIGSSLISFDKDAFTSYGLDQSANASISSQNAARYRAGLNQIIQRGQRLGPMIVGYWYSGAVPIEDDILGDLTEPTLTDLKDAENRAGKLLNAVRSGTRPDLADARYYVIHVSGAAGRVMVRSWREGTFVKLLESISQWFSDLAIVSSDGSTLVRPPKLIAIAATTVREIDDLAPELVSGLHHAGCYGTKIPLTALTGALARTRIDSIENRVRPDRMALLKAYLIRNTQYGEHMTPYLNENHPSPAYHAGRLLGVYANVQRAALGENVNANIVQRFFPSAMATPNLVFGRLAKLCEFHLNKLDGGLPNFFREKIGGIASAIGDGLPRTFNSSEQALFALGYYQQLAFDANDRKQRGSANRSAVSDNDLNEGENQ